MTWTTEEATSQARTYLNIMRMRNSIQFTEDLLQQIQGDVNAVATAPSAGRNGAGSTNPNVTTFRLHPAALTTDILDYSTTSGMRIHEAATAAKLFKFNLDMDQLPAFLDQVRIRSEQHGWSKSIL